MKSTIYLPDTAGNPERQDGPIFVTRLANYSARLGVVA